MILLPDAIFNSINAKKVFKMKKTGFLSKYLEDF